MNVRDVMSTAVVVMAPESGLGDIARKMRDEDIGSIPIAENDRLVVLPRDVIQQNFVKLARAIVTENAPVIIHSPITRQKIGECLGGKEIHP